MQKNKLITHNADFHADDVFATATLFILLDKEQKEYEVIRTRDEEIIKTGDYVYDVGGIYDPASHRFDHHQAGGSGVRENGIPYAAFGLVWKEFGEKVSGSKEVADAIERKLVMPVDANDSAFLVSQSIVKDVFEYTIADAFHAFIPYTQIRNDENLHAAFLEAVAFAKRILSEEIIKSTEKMGFRDTVISIYNNTVDKRIIVLPNYYPWKEFLTVYPEPVFVITPREHGLYQVKAVPDGDPRLFKNRKDFPKTWAGLRDEELAKVSGVPDAVFCHNSLFIAVAKSLEGAQKLAELALNA